MKYNIGQDAEVNVLISESSWAWPLALKDIFRPRGVNILIANRTAEFMNIIQQKRIHAAIIDMDSEQANGFGTIRLIRMGFPLLPCLVLKSQVNEMLLCKALELDVFSVLNKPVDMLILQRQLDRVFSKRYNSNIFAVER
jgi:DNA-binding NtrC family response regulator